MTLTLRILTAALLLTGGCAAIPEPADPVASMYRGDPADPAGPEAPVVAPESLAGDVPPSMATPEPSPHHGHETHGHETHGHETHGHETHGHETPAADAAYVCPMHPDQTSSEPGTCSICGMDLVPMEDEP